MQLVKIHCKECKHHSDFHVEQHRQFFKHGSKIVDVTITPSKGFVYCEKLAQLCSGDEYNLPMPADGFCSYGEPVELKDVTNKDKI